MSNKVGVDWTKLLSYSYLQPVPQNDGTIKVRCPFHDDDTPSAYLFPTGYYYCFGCDAKGRVPTSIAEKIIGGELEEYNSEYARHCFPQDDEVRQQTAIYRKATSVKGGEDFWRSLAEQKLLSLDIVQVSSIPTRQGLMFPAYCWPWRGSQFNPTFTSYIKESFPYPLYICGAQYRIKDVMDKDPDLKAITRGYRGLGMPGQRYRPKWAWGGKVEASYRYIVVSEGPQHALKFAAALQGYALSLCTFGSKFSPWQMEAVQSLSPDYLVVTKDADSWREKYREALSGFKPTASTGAGLAHLYLDVDPLSPEALRRVLGDLGFRTP